jgi:hypothetical protein
VDDRQRAVVAGADITQSLPDTPLDTDEGLCAAIGNLPKAVFRWGLDNRG